ncbi:peptide/nickel transport system substrate-binding protein [Brevinema andersonii]|uniref:Peptide/nickel transport system substrate-binding protein n=1 Tax=Brevinema andersonii TaxID=34097 RepID=A0A1I1E765_BREAD|nr:ABC transporter substrate-binding protein [Brevinema andersonii]SFB82927.1 peptide/nickel transport system substrate-binding protein [Brevinema andersonii]
MNLSKFLRFYGRLSLVFIFLSCMRHQNDTVVVAVTGESALWDPHISTADPYVGFVISSIFDRLLELQDDGSFMPSLAVSWTNTAPTTWEFQLRTNVLFHDGLPFTAEDVIFSIQRMKASPGVSFLVSFIQTIDALNEYTVRIELSQLYADFLNDLARPHASIVSKKFTPARDCKIGDAPMGTGAYRYASATPWQGINFTAFPQYYGNSPSISKNFYRNIPDPAVRTIALETKEVDVAHTLGADLEVLKKIRHIQLYSFLAPKTEFIGFNFKTRPKFSDKHLREVIAIAVDKLGIIRVGVDETAEVAASLLSHRISYYTNLPPKPFDLQKAKELIQSAGMRGQTFVLSVNEGFRTKIAEVIQANLKEIGLNIEIQVLQWGALQEHLAKGSLEMYLFGCTTATLDADAMLYPLLHSFNFSSGGNAVGYANSDLDVILEKARSETDSEKGKLLYAKIQMFLDSELPVVPLFYPIVYTAVSKRLTNFSMDVSLTPVFRNMRFK